MKTYQVVTKDRTYNHIEADDPIHLMEKLIEVRRVWGDMSPTVEVWEWVPGQWWIRVNKDEMVEKIGD